MNFFDEINYLTKMLSVGRFNPTQYYFNLIRLKEQMTDVDIDRTKIDRLISEVKFVMGELK